MTVYITTIMHRGPSVLFNKPSGSTLGIITLCIRERAQSGGVITTSSIRSTKLFPSLFCFISVFHCGDLLFPCEVVNHFSNRSTPRMFFGKTFWQIASWKACAASPSASMCSYPLLYVSASCQLDSGPSIPSSSTSVYACPTL